MHTFVRGTWLTERTSHRPSQDVVSHGTYALELPTVKVAALLPPRAQYNADGIEHRTDLRYEVGLSRHWNKPMDALPRWPRLVPAWKQLALSIHETQHLISRLNVQLQLMDGRSSVILIQASDVRSSLFERPRHRRDQNHHQGTSTACSVLDRPRQYLHAIQSGPPTSRGQLATVSRRARHGPYAGRALPPDDARQDRTLSPVAEERREAREIYSPWELERALTGFVEDYNHQRVHESLDNVTPADVYLGRRPTILARRERIKQQTWQQRRQENLRTPHPAAQRREVSLV